MVAPPFRIGQLAVLKPKLPSSPFRLHPVTPARFNNPRFELRKFR
jgi:hypothetical protein